jgi:hypothetical protein
MLLAKLTSRWSHAAGETHLPLAPCCWRATLPPASPAQRKSPIFSTLLDLCARERHGHYDYVISTDERTSIQSRARTHPIARYQAPHQSQPTSTSDGTQQ